MKLILDEWIVREVIDTLYMARTTLLGITGLDSPQEVAKKSANETAITQRISKAIDIIQQSDEQQHIPDGMNEAAEKYCEKVNHRQTTIITDSFKAGAEWQKEKMLKDCVIVKCYVRVYPTLDDKPRPWVALYKNGIGCNSLCDIPELENIGFKDNDTAIVIIKRKEDE